MADRQVDNKGKVISNKFKNDIFATCYYLVVDYMV